MANKTSIEKLEEKVKGNWSAIKQAYSDAAEKEEQISGLLKEYTSSGETSIAVFGSLARKEWTQGSDVDWTLLIDGPANREHRLTAQSVSGKLEENGLKSPGREGVFGNMAFSHDIVHQIGGQKDTNHNTTQRILLLSESRCIGDSDAYDRVVKSVLDRYIEDDISLLTSTGKVPRFLLNDIVRYWRTMAVDYAHKVYERGGEGWALRNIKLRFSRKLIFAAGLLTCFSCKLKPSKFIKETSDKNLDLQRLGFINHLKAYVKKTPLEIVAEFLCEYATIDAAKQVMDSYDKFVGMLSDEKNRQELDDLKESAKDDSKLFNQACEWSGRFQQGLNSLFFDDNDKLKTLTRKYGVF